MTIESLSVNVANVPRWRRVFPGSSERAAMLRIRVLDRSFPHHVTSDNRNRVLSRDLRSVLHVVE